MNSIIELHDSTVAAISREGSAIEVRFEPAYVHKSTGRPGIDPGTGWTQDARLVISGASLTGTAPDLPCAVLDGDLLLGQERHDNSLPVPLDMAGLIRLRLEFGLGSQLIVTGVGVRLELLGEPCYVEDFEP